MGTTIYTSIKKHHDIVRGLLEKLVKDITNVKLFKEFQNEITSHDKAEERTFYKLLKKKLGKLDIIIDFNHSEHEGVDKLIKLYDKIIKKDDENDKNKLSLLKVIKMSLEAHMEKEETEIFPLAQYHLTDDEAKEVNIVYLEKKAEFEKK